jgi:hypothetical protein
VVPHVETLKVWEGYRTWKVCRSDVGEAIFEVKLLKSRHEMETVEEQFAGW